MTNDQFSGIFYNNGNFSRVDDVLAVEESLSISINGEPFTVTMRTPGNEQELVRGLLYTEEVYRDLENDPEFEILETNAKGYTTTLNIKIADDKILKNFAAS